MEEDLEVLLMLNGIKAEVIKPDQMDLYFPWIIMKFIIIRIIDIIFIVIPVMALLLEEGLIFIYAIVAIQVIIVVIIPVTLMKLMEKRMLWLAVIIS